MNLDATKMSGPVESLCYTAGPWGVEQTATTNWIGPLQKDGKVSAIVASTSRESLNPESLKRNDANAHLLASAPTLLDERDNLAILVLRLVRAIKKNDTGNTVANQALDYLTRKELLGSPIR